MTLTRRMILLSLLICSSIFGWAARARATEISQPDATGVFAPLWTDASRLGAHAPAEVDAIESRIDDPELGEDNPEGLQYERWMMMTGGDRTITAQKLIDAAAAMRSMRVVSAGARRTAAQDADLW